MSRKTFLKSKDIINIGVKTMLIMIIASMLIPFLIDKFIFGNSYRSNITNGEWASFLGSLLGGLIGGIGTLTAVLITVKEARNVEYRRERPILILEERDRGNNWRVDRRFYIGYASDAYIDSLEIKNIGLGIATNIEIVVEVVDEEKIFIKSFGNVIPSDKSLKGISIEKRLWDFLCPLNINYEEPIEIRYEDLFGNKYFTKYKLARFESERIEYLQIKETISVGN
ncbi:hypothetical protein SAMN00017405_0403 [Desulfonispora thiosulfatigenes DSM 11270]|uniref:Uncharacterized protein n=1 Tax=Desulfonispora thiosulfatigenes DSM 11270 TaxID=656914 RepID=A0A1W1VQS9_DESTI|nr:hypothetical protein [Desulfonispora thiosulfatigenes]SMB95441.1 hypothetical protein SAMN00017405_0403 [Desulfonispora thiosulfatigenes DSM 11270]